MFDFFKRMRAKSYPARTYERFPAHFCCIVFVGEINNDVKELEVRDLSSGGMGIITENPIDANTRLLIILEAPALHPLLVKGNVVWSKPNAMGIRFDDDPKLAPVVDRLLENYRVI